MVKLFGWERRALADIADTREHELSWIWKRKLLGAMNNVIKCVHHCLICYVAS